MVGPAERRWVAEWARSVFQVSARRACSAVGVARLYREEGLSLRRKKPRRRKSAVTRRARPEPTGSNQGWSMDLMHDARAHGRTPRIFELIDVFVRECLALTPARYRAGVSRSSARARR